MQKLVGTTGYEAQCAWRDGVQLDIFAPEQRGHLYKAYGMMCLSRGFSSFHADAHPGNFMVPGLCLVSYI